MLGIKLAAVFLIMILVPMQLFGMAFRLTRMDAGIYPYDAHIVQRVGQRMQVVSYLIIILLTVGCRPLHATLRQCPPPGYGRALHVPVQACTRCMRQRREVRRQRLRHREHRWCRPERVSLCLLQGATDEKVLVLVKHVNVGVPCTMEGLHKGIAGAQEECCEAS